MARSDQAGCRGRVWRHGGARRPSGGTGIVVWPPTSTAGPAARAGHKVRAGLCLFIGLWFCLGLMIPVLVPASAGAVTQAAAAGNGESYVVKSDGSLWAWGGNAWAELGAGDRLPVALPLQVGGAHDWARVAVRGTQTLALKQNGSLWHWGAPALPPLVTPTPLTGGTWTGPWDALATSVNHSLLIKKSDGGLWAWGDNTYGQLGTGAHGPATGSGTPVHVLPGTQWKSVAAGFKHSAGVRADGSLWTWGDNADGQLGHGDTVDRYSPTRVGTATDWAAVWAGYASTYALKADGTLWSWGDNGMGQLGLGSTGGTHRSPTMVAGGSWKTLSAASLHCAALKTDGSLWTWGFENSPGGMLGRAGLVGGESYPTPTRVGTGTGWAAVAAGPYHTLAVTSDDRFAAGGGNYHGQVGVGYPYYRCVPEQIGTVGGWKTVDASLSHAAAVRTDGTLWTWGYNSSGELGYAGSSTAPQQVGTEAVWKSVSCGARTEGGFTLAIRTDGTLWAWGDNATGQLGLGDTVSRDFPQQVGTGADWVQVAASDGVGTQGRVIYGQPYSLDDHALGVKSDGSLWAWGSSSYGQLGLGDTTTREVPTRVGTETDWSRVACGDDFSAALKTDGSLWTWGHNRDGQLGLGDTVDRSSPVRVLTGSGPQTFTDVACGSGRDGQFMLAVKTDGTLWGWGSNGAGELGQGDFGAATYPAPVQIGGANDWAGVACGHSYGDNFGLAMKTGGAVWAWGGNYRGQLGNGDFVPLRTPQAAADGVLWTAVTAGSNTFAIKPDGTLWAWGDNTNGQLGLGDPASIPATSVYDLATFVDVEPPSVSTAVGSRGGSATAAAGRRGRSGRTLSTRAGGWSRKPVTITLRATDAVSGVSRPQISLNGGVSYVTRSKVKISNAVAKVLVRAIDRAGNRSTPKLVGTYRIDSQRPRTVASTVRVKRGATAKLRYRIVDVSPCLVRIVVKGAGGASLRQFTVRGAKPGAVLVKRFRATLKRGAYRWYVYATDSVGLRQTQAGVGKLVVQ